MSKKWRLGVIPIKRESVSYSTGQEQTLHLQVWAPVIGIMVCMELVGLLAIFFHFTETEAYAILFNALFCLIIL